ncbi:cbb3-type cytochrome oxidase assembly protein CcoS [Marinobacter sp. M216]|uniref:Cbb3-type cytochrome oxidase assembly protein CcoS n=2 Tax=Marinobacteraceae TaxID=2887365 RepID=A0ABT7HCA7_9GAMM|nr:MULTISPECIES: cbb3-type cytochrome oxidase assembly protein CcoS [unclassified Marinobacter]MBW7470194.1 cbb3-type cytochrome oxidase assembly protein CcoS [Marinobacter sp. F4218]MDK9557542.1 cbb3-type cytochrome oxidase assembly protein CcoS [Marinobacter sp. M216]
MILVPLVLIVVALGIFLFSWAVKSGQYDDLEGPAHRILYDDDKDMIPDDARTDKPTSRPEEEAGESPEPDSDEDAPKP